MHSETLVNFMKIVNLAEYKAQAISFSSASNRRSMEKTVIKKILKMISKKFAVFGWGYPEHLEPIGSIKQ